MQCFVLMPQNEMEFNKSSNDSIYDTKLLYELNHARMVFVIPVIVFLFLNMVVGAVGNTLVLIVYMCLSGRTVANHYILVVASIDMICCCCCIPFQIYDVWNPYINSTPVLCRMERFLENFTNLLNGFILVCVASERFRKICYPLEPYPLGTAKRLTIILIIMSLSLSWPQLVINGKQTIQVGKEKVIGEDCSYNDAFQNSIYVFLFQGFLYVIYILSVSCCVFFYVNIAIVIIKRKRLLKRTSQVTETNKVSTSCPSSQVKHTTLGCVNGRIQMRSSKTTLCLVSISVAAIITYVPFLTIQTARTSGKYFQTTITPTGEFYHYGSSPTTDLLCTLGVKSYFLNSALNPLIYSVMNSKFRSQVKCLFRQNS